MMQNLRQTPLGVSVQLASLVWWQDIQECPVSSWCSDGGAVLRIDGPAFGLQL